MKDTDLIENILARDKRALSTFYRSYTPKLLRLIRTKVANENDCEEVLQDTLFAFLEAIRDFRSGCRLETFIFSICRHKIIDFYRRKKIRHIVFSKVPQLEELMSPVLNPEEELDVTLYKEKIHRVFAGILPRYRQILMFKYIDGLSIEDIARKLTITYKGAESQLFRARRAFVDLFVSI